MRQQKQVDIFKSHVYAEGKRRDDSDYLNQEMTNWTLLNLTKIESIEYSEPLDVSIWDSLDGTDKFLESKRKYEKTHIKDGESKPSNKYLKVFQKFESTIQKLKQMVSQEKKKNPID